MGVSRDPQPVQLALSRITTTARLGEHDWLSAHPESRRGELAEGGPRTSTVSFIASPAKWNYIFQTVATTQWARMSRTDTR